MNKTALLQLDIEPFIQDGNKMTEWRRPALEILLKLYKEHPVLYDMRHPKYYNKGERQKALSTIVDMLEDHRPGTTVNDILKKIQVMRTQFGQELGKAKRAQHRGQEYAPTVWWYNYLSFLRFHIKQRTVQERDEDEEYNVSITQNSDEDYENYTTEESYDIDNEGQSEIVYEIQSTPTTKGNRTEYTAEAKVLRKRDLPNPITINGSSKDELIYEITNSSTLVPKRKIEVITPDGLNPKYARQESQVEASSSPSGSGKRTETFEMTVESDRARSLGQFVSSQISLIKDDYLFYSTQMDVLNAINKAQLKQLQLDKGTNNLD